MIFKNLRMKIATSIIGKFVAIYNIYKESIGIGALSPLLNATCETITGCFEFDKSQKVTDCGEQIPPPISAGK